MIDVHTTRNVLIITLSGDIDVASAPALTTTLATATSGDWRAIVVECDQLQFIDLVGARPLALAHRAAAEGQTAFYLLHPSPQVIRVLDLLDLGPAVVLAEPLPTPYAGTDDQHLTVRAPVASAARRAR
jgi:anti-anti-sigma factor